MDPSQTLSVADQGNEPFADSIAKNHLRVEHSGDDAEIAIVLAAARASCEKQAERTIRVDVDYLMTMEAFPRSNQIRIPRPPLRSITALKYYDADETLQTVDASNYSITTSEVTHGFLHFLDVFERPTIATRRDAVQIEFTAGYASAADVPQDLVAAILFQIDLLWDHDADPQIIDRYQRTRDALLSNWDPGSYA